MNVTGATANRSARRAGGPVSLPQRDLWFTHQLAPSAYNEISVCEVHGRFDADAWARSLQGLVDRHETLRTSFSLVGDEVLRTVHDEALASLEVIGAHGWDDERVHETLVELTTRPFDLERPPLIKGYLLELGQDRRLLVHVFDHIVLDGTSWNLARAELVRAYAGEKIAPRRGEVSYSDYVAWQKHFVGGRGGEKDMAFWREELSGVDVRIALPLTRQRPPVRSFAGETVAFPIDAALERIIRDAAQRLRSTPHTVMLAALQAMLHRYTSSKQVVIACSAAARPTAFANALGHFVNPLLVRADFTHDTTFGALVERSTQRVLRAMAHQSLPLGSISHRLGLRASDGISPFDVSYSTLRLPSTWTASPKSAIGARIRKRGLTLRVGDALFEDAAVDLPRALFDLAVSVIEQDGGIVAGELRYDTDLFERETIVRMSGHLCELLADGAARPEASVTSLRLMPAEERRRVVEEWNGEPAAGEDAGIHDLVLAQAERTSDAVAVEDETRSLSYRELTNRARRIASWLSEKGVRRESRVAVSLERSVDMVAAVLGVMWAGGAYVPIDPRFPPDRRELMRSDSSCVVELDETTLAEALSTEATSTPPARGSARDLAYVLYTSGSTGRPKGVMVEHGAVVRFLRAMQERPGLSANDVLVAVTTLSFDIAGLELYLPLIVGARVVIASRDCALDPSALAALIARSRATVMQATPVTWRMLVAANWRPPPGFKALCGGEAIPQDLVGVLAAPGKALWNMYGPTETTIWSTCAPLTAGAALTIGGPIEGTTTYVLDPAGEPTPIGVPGELHIGGCGVARGYFARGPLTAERFVPDPFSKTPGARMYRTGDLARWRRDGTLECLGRVDHQVKVRGHRIELGEIEAAIDQAPDVRECVVVARADGMREKRLVAYVVPRRRKVDVDALKTRLSSALPDYMVPNLFVEMEALPLTANGKIDRNALPVPDLTSSTAEYVAPRTPLEHLIATIWQDVLGIERVGARDDFFALGGHSVLLMQVVSRLRAQLERDLPVRVMFEATTVGALATRVEREANEAQPPPIERTDAPGGSVVSYWQQAVLAWEREREPSTTWFVPQRVEFAGRLDVAKLRDAIARVLDRQEALRHALYRDPARTPGLYAAGDVPVPFVDLRGASEDTIAEAVRERIGAPFVLDGSPLIRFVVVQLANDKHALYAVWHQLVHEAVFANIIIDEILETYGALVEQRGPNLPTLDFRYTDYAIWERAWFQGRGAALVDGARKRLAGASPLPLPIDRSRDGAPPLEPVNTAFALDLEDSTRFWQLCHSAQVTAFMGAFAVVGLVLGQWCGTDEVTVVTPISTRTRDDLGALAGRFGNWLPLRLSVAGKPTIADVFARARRDVTAALVHASVPAPLVFEKDDVFAHPLGRVVVNMPLNDGFAETSTVALPGVTASYEQMMKETGARTELSLAVIRKNGCLRCGITGAASVFDASTIERFAEALARRFRTIDLAERL